MPLGGVSASLRLPLQITVRLCFSLVDSIAEIGVTGKDGYNKHLCQSPFEAL